MKRPYITTHFVTFSAPVGEIEISISTHYKRQAIIYAWWALEEEYFFTKEEAKIIRMQTVRESIGNSLNW